jgi:aminoacyl tRNA synthase complex-interacting multifunctional protein 1
MQVNNPSHIFRIFRNSHQHCRRLRPPLSASLRIAPRVPVRSASLVSNKLTPLFFTPLEPVLINFFRQRPPPKMASSSLDESLVTFLKTHAPNDAFAETDPVKASQLLFPETTYTDGEKAEISQWVITSSHIGLNVCTTVENILPHLAVALPAY